MIATDAGGVDRGTRLARSYNLTAAEARALLAIVEGCAAFLRGSGRTKMITCRLSKFEEILWTGAAAFSPMTFDNIWAFDVRSFQTIQPVTTWRC